LKAAELQKRLGITPAVLKSLVDRGLPVDRRGRIRYFDVAAVDAWLLANGFAEPEPPPAPPELICETYADLAVALGMTSRDPNRVIAGWATQPGFPGTPGTPGKRNARLPVEQIRQWLATRESTAELGPKDDELRELDRERRRLQIELESQHLREQLNRLADVDEVARFNRQVAADAQAILRPLADEVVALLPSKTAARIRAAIHKQTNDLLDDAFETIARIVQGDTNAEESNAAEATAQATSSPVKRKRSGTKKARGRSRRT
jgi:hypothetical protein